MDDLLRRFFGLHPRNYGFPDNNSSASPENDHYTFIHPHRDHGPGHDSRWPSEFDMPDQDFNSFFREVEENFERMNKLFGSLHNSIDHHTQHSSSEGQSHHDSPRDTLLKEPDSKSPYEHPMNPALPRTPFNYHDSEDLGSIAIFGGIDSFPDPFHMMDEMIKSFSGFSMTPNFFESIPNAPNTEDSRDLPMGGRDALLKKDSDLDHSGGLPSLSEGGPGYSYGDDRSPESSALRPSIRRNFHSSSIVRIVKPDGTIEETKKYRDSSGREEVTVTHIDPRNNDQNPNIYGNQPPIVDLQTDQCTIS